MTGWTVICGVKSDMMKLPCANVLDRTQTDKEITCRGIRKLVLEQAH